MAAFWGLSISCFPPFSKACGLISAAFYVSMAIFHVSGQLQYCVIWPGCRNQLFNWKKMSVGNGKPISLLGYKLFTTKNDDRFLSTYLQGKYFPVGTVFYPKMF